MTRTRETLRLTHERSGILVADFSRNEGAHDHAVVFLHGLGSIRNGDKAQAIEAACARRGWAFAALDLRGHGESAGSMVELCCSGLLEDLELLRVALAERGLTRVCPVGSSMGGWAAAWWSIVQPAAIPGCVLLAPAFHFPMGLWQRLPPEARERWRQTGRLHLVNDWMDAVLGYGLIEDASKYPIEKMADSWRKPALIFHGMRDDVVPYRNTLELVERLPDGAIEVRLFREGDHRLVEYKDEMAEEACRFFERVLRTESCERITAPII